ncbi:MAG: type II toxin-antitoxin system RelE/ParE family toxin [Spirulina sp.]
MKTEYRSSFIKDLKALKSAPSYKTIRRVALRDIPQCNSQEEIRNLKKVKGKANAYRIRVGDYRIGVFIQKDTITFARVLHRREMYRHFF